MSKIYTERKHSAKEELLQTIKRDRKLLLEWTKMTTEHPYIGFGCFKFPNYSLPFWLYSVTTLGGVGQISLKLKNVAMDIDENGAVTEEEFESNAEAQKVVIDQSLSLLGTLGVVGALIFSVLYSTVLSPLDPSDVSTNYFSAHTLTAFTYVYYACVYFALGKAFSIICQSVILYLKISVWMPNLELKMWFLSDVSLTPVVHSAMVSLILASLAIPFG